jgi:hypothetical protein
MGHCTKGSDGAMEEWSVLLNWMGHSCLELDATDALWFSALRMVSVSVSVHVTLHASLQQVVQY